MCPYSSANPEEQELELKRARLAVLEAELVEREEEVATLNVQLGIFAEHYRRLVGVRYAELDAIEAQIAEALARLNPLDITAQDTATRTREQAYASARETQNIQQESALPPHFKPIERLKKLFREAAKRLHPDLATDEEERARRTRVMADVNRAYEQGDEEELKRIVQAWEHSPENVEGEGTAAELVRVIRKIAQVESRLQQIETEIAQLKSSDIYQLKVRAEEAEAQGYDLMAWMCADLDDKIAQARRRLEQVQQSGSTASGCHAPYMVVPGLGDPILEGDSEDDFHLPFDDIDDVDDPYHETDDDFYDDPYDDIDDDFYEEDDDEYDF